MALIEVFHVVASQFPIDTSSATIIPQGRLVTLDGNGQVQLCPDADGVTGPYPVGIAGDSHSTGTTSYTPESGAPLSRDPVTSLTGSLIVGSYGTSQRFTQNRSADNYDEVLASGKMTVYHSGGEFWTDQYEVTNSASDATVFTPGFTLWSSSVAANIGMFTDEECADATQLNDASHRAGITLTSPTAYPSGVPGTGTNAVGFSALPEGGNSIAWGTFLHVKLTV